MSTLVRVEGLEVRYGAREALRGVSLSLEAGRVVAVVGPNGAGKTTLIRSMFGDLPLAAGRVEICGLDPTVPASKARLWSVARLVGDTPALHEELSVRESLELAARLFGVPAAAVDRVTSDVASNLGLYGLDEVRVGELSFGNRKKVHVAAGFFAGASGPRVLVLDEPTVGLDPPSRRILMQALRQYVGHAGSERAVLISSHNLSELDAVADYVVMLNAGRVVKTGTLSALAAARSADLAYRLSLFDDEAANLATALARRFDLDTEVLEPNVLSFACADAAALQEILRFTTRSSGPFRVRELREELSALERVFLEGLDESGCA